MRIIAGRNRGVRLATLGKGDAAAHLRPTPDRVRESLFNILNNRLDFQGLRVLDLFAGTGALGLEALSRGAAQCAFVENGRIAGKILGQNIQITGHGEDTQVLRCDATKLPCGQAADLVFMDPPYGKNLGASALTSAWAQGWIAQDALIVWEESNAMQHPEFKTLDQRRFGTTTITLLTPTSAAPVDKDDSPA